MTKYTVHSFWTKEAGANQEKRDKAIEEVLRYREHFRILTQEILPKLKKNPAIREYDENWSQKQIARNEYNGAIDEIINILTIRETS
jgi:hypothetical protein